MSDIQAIIQRAGQAFDEGKDDEATMLAEQILRSTPHNARAYQVLGMIHVRSFRPTRGIELLEHALTLDPGQVATHCQLGVGHGMLGDQVRATEQFETALRMEPDHVASRFNLAQVQLQQGRFREGWLGYEWRWRTGEVSRPNIPRPRWDGRPLLDRSILVHTEQGLGDTLQFVRMLSLLKQQGARVVFACQKPMHQLLRNLPWVDDWFPIDEEAKITFDWYTPMLSLPGLLGINSESDIPKPDRSVTPDPVRVEKWRARLDAIPGLKVGLNWQGKPSQGRDAVRSIPLRQFKPLADVEGVTLISLHKGSGEEQIEECRGTVPLTVLDGLDEGSDEGGAFVDTAAVMSLLDLVISTDTSIVHLAGVLGCPVWVPVSTACDWRFMCNRTDSPWYPSMRLFRQRVFNVWEPVITEIAGELSRFRNQGGNRARPERLQTAQGVPLERIPTTPVSIGELIDKITILEIKQNRISHPDKLANVSRELGLLSDVRSRCVVKNPQLDRLTGELKAINEQLWEIEDDIRELETEGDFGEQFVRLARDVYLTNDRRAQVKRRINELCGSALIEEKSYSSEYSAAS